MPFSPDRPPPPGGMKYHSDHGYVVIGPNSDGCAVIHELWVDPEHRRCGEGTSLVGIAHVWASLRELSPLIVHCSPHNHDSQAFYEKLGMKAVSIVYQAEVKD